MNTALKKKSLEESLSGHTAQVVEVVRTLETPGNTNLSKQLNFFRENLGELLVQTDVQYKHRSKAEELGVLTPDEIKLFFEVASHYQDDPDFDPLFAAQLTRLLYDSFKEGHNGFELSGDCLTRPINGMFWGLQSVTGEDRRMSLKYNGDGHGFNSLERVDVHLYGDVGSSFGRFSKKSTFHIEGHADFYLGHGTQNCEFVVEGNVAHSCGTDSMSGKYVLKQTVGPRIGQNSHNSSYEIQGDYLVNKEQSEYQKRIMGNCEFSTSSRKSLKALIKDIPAFLEGSFSFIKEVRGRPSKNKIIYLHSDGREEMVKDY